MIRKETPQDIQDIRKLNDVVFTGPVEGTIVDRRGIGTALVTEGLRQLQESGCVVVVVLGHAEYYPRFGFSPAGEHGLKCQWSDVPDDVFMVRFIKKEYDGVVCGTVTYLKEFDEAVQENDVPQNREQLAQS
jgi:putative acetyltransferase